MKRRLNKDIGVASPPASDHFVGLKPNLHFYIEIKLGDDVRDAHYFSQNQDTHLLFPPPFNGCLNSLIRRQFSI